MRGYPFQFYPSRPYWAIIMTLLTLGVVLAKLRIADHDDLLAQKAAKALTQSTSILQARNPSARDHPLSPTSAHPTSRHIHNDAIITTNILPLYKTTTPASHRGRHSVVNETMDMLYTLQRRCARLAVGQRYTSQAAHRHNGCQALGRASLWQGAHLLGRLSLRRSAGASRWRCGRCA